MTFTRNAFLIIVFVLASGPMAEAQPGDDFVVHRVVSGLSRPVFATAAPGEWQNLYVVEQHTGRIRVINLRTESLSPVAFNTVGGVSTGSEQGLLGLAFHPDYEQNGYYYVYLTDPHTRIRRYQVPDAPGAPHVATEVLSFNQPRSNHNAGWIGFGPDGYLYIASGDGGSGNDPDNHGQTIENDLLGKILRIDVDGDDFPADGSRNYAIPPDNPFVGTTGDDEIWAYGLRNPWRCSFDRLRSGDFYCGDVGQGRREEIDFIPASRTTVSNFGWRLREGTIATPGVGGARPSNNVDPIHDYPRTDGYSVTGGYVYRGSVASLRGKYFFADYGSDRIWSLERDEVTPAPLMEWTNVLDVDAGTLRNVSSFGEDFFGELYLVTLGGSVYRFDARDAPDGDDDGVPDLVDNCTLAANGPRAPDRGGHVQRDTDRDGYGNLCDPDLDGNGRVTLFDVNLFVQRFRTADPDADFDGNGRVTLFDFIVLRRHYRGVPGPSGTVPSSGPLPQQ